MVLSFSTESLSELCSKDQLELLDAIDGLRLHGIDHYISLPQIIVCGDQSSGKSSVLEAISGVPFPVKSNLCTQFPIELILRRSKQTSVSVSIVPHSDHGQSEKDRLSQFQQGLDGLEGLPKLLRVATNFMGLTSQGQSFSKNLLRVEITGPDRPHLTIVDMPGLIHSATKQQTAADVELVEEVVKGYMAKARSIILAVVTAKNDFANQIVLKLARAADPIGERTLGIITKPDTLVDGSASQRMFLSLAKNKEIEFLLGWHVLKNLDTDMTFGSFLLHQRNKEESAFLSEGVWKTLPTSILGISELRNRLAQLLPQQIASELPGLINEINLKLVACRNDLNQLGGPRFTVAEQHLYLLRIAQDFQGIVKSSVNGTYNGPFYKSAESDRGYEQRVRAVVQNLNAGFADTLGKYGHRRQLKISKDEIVQTTESEPPILVTEVEFLKHICKLMSRSHGTELPGKYNAMIVADLFLEQSTPWKDITDKHIRQVWVSARKFLTTVAEYVCEAAVSARLIDRVIDPFMREILGSMKKKSEELLKSCRTIHPITFNDLYVSGRIKNYGDEERRAACSDIVRELVGDPMSTSENIRRCVNVSELVERLVQRTKPSIEKEAAAEALSSLMAYYNIALKRFIDNVAIEVVEEKLLAALPDVLSPLTIFNLGDAMIETIAGESEASRRSREQLIKQIDVLEKGFQSCKRFAGDQWTDEMSSQLQFEAADNDGESGFCVPTEGIQSKGVPPDVVNMLGSVVQTTIPDGVTCPQSSIPTEEMTTCSQEIPCDPDDYDSLALGSMMKHMEKTKKNKGKRVIATLGWD